MKTQVRLYLTEAVLSRLEDIADELKYKNVNALMLDVLEEAAYGYFNPNIKED